MNEEYVRESFYRHVSEPDVTTEEYFQGLACSLGQSIASKRKIYLDTCYWIFLRDADLGRPKRPEHAEILQLIRGLVTSGCVLCPISDVAYMESMQQTDEVTRTATAKLMDELSLGVALLTEQSRVRAELRYFLEHPTPDDNAPPLKQLVWVKACYVLGEGMPVISNASREFNRALQKTSIDTFWQMSLLERAKDSNAIMPLAERFEASAAQVNINKDRYAHEIRSIQQAFVAEIGGALRAFKSDITRFQLELHERRTGTSITTTKEELERFTNSIQALLINAFRLAPKKMAQRIPTLYVYALSHAAMRWDKCRKFDAHWLLDLHHASAGVGYHDAMFTENPLRVLLTAGNVALDREYGINILSAERDVINYLNGVQQ